MMHKNVMKLFCHYYVIFIFFKNISKPLTIQYIQQYPVRPIQDTMGTGNKSRVMETFPEALLQILLSKA